MTINPELKAYIRKNVAELEEYVRVLSQGKPYKRDVKEWVKLVMEQMGWNVKPVPTDPDTIFITEYFNFVIRYDTKGKILGSYVLYKHYELETEETEEG